MISHTPTSNIYRSLRPPGMSRLTGDHNRWRYIRTQLSQPGLSLIEQLEQSSSLTPSREEVYPVDAGHCWYFRLWNEHEHGGAFVVVSQLERADLLAVTMSPAVENTLSLGTEVADVCEEHLHPEQQQWSFRMRTEEPQPSHIKKEEEYSLITHFKEEGEDPLTPHIKEEEEEHNISQQGEHLEGLEEVDVTKMPVTGVPVKSEDDEVKGESEEKREAEPPSSSSTQHMTTEADGDHCGGSQADKILAPLSDSENTTSHSPDTDDEHSKDDEEDDPQPTYIKEEEEDPQHTHMKEEEEDPHMKEEEEGECVVEQEEDDVSKFPLTVVSVKTEEHEDKAPESSQLHHSPNVQRVSAGSHEEEWHTSVGQKELQAPSHIKEEQLHDEDEAQSLQLHHSQRSSSLDKQSATLFSVPALY
ncbi:uncharacterized protein [Nerophis lumbriciformis]|uniref:uncharacterized protein n=1 Tax=Nerophis lumbriciformis TaxID=546530 RepID=UPI003BADA716